MAEADAQMKPEAQGATEPLKHPRKWLRLLIMVSVPLLILIGGIAYYLANDHYVSTDNAYVQQDKVSVAAEIGGRIVEVGVKENQHVNAGDLLFRIDPEPFKIAIAQAEASIAAAQVKVVTLQTDLGNSGVDIQAARDDVAFFTEEYKRQSSLMQSGFTTKARLQAAEHALSTARSKLARAEADAKMARAALATGAAAPGVNPGVLAGQAQRDKALLDLSKAEVRAAASGTVSQADRLQLGQMMVQGLPALTIVTDGKGWVEANFKETDLAKMRVGQSADVSFDAYPGLKVKGRVASIGAGTGSEFSVLPAQNASGNWVKVTQRVPVRIEILEKPKRQMIAGLSAYVRIDTSK
ncbi:HlyD family secretion protein [Sphingorhabdus sp.]|uniref:HlyD family secretion protein n=1 Tax=Sphingorhabdus sp. TaxID=1902408 RepID=UPI0032B7E0BC